MPICFLEAPTGITADAKKKMMESATAALFDTYRIPDVRIFLREYPPENVSQDGRIAAEPVRPVFFIEGPPLPRIDAKRKMVERLHAALAEAYRGITNTDEIMVFVNQYALDNAASNGRLQSENPQVVEAVETQPG
jgi:hypothetical protein